MDKNLVRLSKFVSLVLRHQPDVIGLQLDVNGWAEVDSLLNLAKQNGTEIFLEQLEEIVATNDKKRFSFNVDKTRIRANQGHSLEIALDLVPIQPPDILFHGTATRFVESIVKQGLLAGKRQHVHLSSDEATALKVGQRHGKPIVLTINAAEMYRDGYVFFCSENLVWLTEFVPSKYIQR